MGPVSETGISDLLCHQKRKRLRTLLGGAEQGAVLLEGKVDLDEPGALEELDDHAGSDDGSDTEFHERSSVRGEDDTHPVQRVWRKETLKESLDVSLSHPTEHLGSQIGSLPRTGRVRRDDSIERDLRADEEDEQRDRSPSDLGERAASSARSSHRTACTRERDLPWC